MVPRQGSVTMPVRIMSTSYFAMRPVSGRVLLCGLTRRLCFSITRFQAIYEPVVQPGKTPPRPTPSDGFAVAL